MIEGRESVAPDLSEIRRTDEIIDIFASRRRPRPRVLLDPAVALLASLAADVDAAPLTASRSVGGFLAGSGSGPQPGPGTGWGSMAGAWRWPAHRASGMHPVSGRRHRTAVAAATAAIATVAAVVATAGFVVVFMLSRLTAACRWGGRD